MWKTVRDNGQSEWYVVMFKDAPSDSVNCSNLDWKTILGRSHESSKFCSFGLVPYWILLVCDGEAVCLVSGTTVPDNERIWTNECCRYVAGLDWGIWNRQVQSSQSRNVVLSPCNVNKKTKRWKIRSKIQIWIQYRISPSISRGPGKSPRRSVTKELSRSDDSQNMGSWQNWTISVWS